MAIGSGGGGGGPMSEINVTPLVDVMLVLLIIFMVTAPLVQAGMKVDLPNANAPEMPVGEQKLQITVGHRSLQDPTSPEAWSLEPKACVAAASPTLPALPALPARLARPLFLRAFEPDGVIIRRPFPEVVGSQ